jgi:hypothetical protein
MEKGFLVDAPILGDAGMFLDHTEDVLVFPMVGLPPPIKNKKNTLYFFLSF